MWGSHRDQVGARSRRDHLTAPYARRCVSLGVGWPGPATPSASAPGPAGRSCTSPSCIDDSVRGGSDCEAPLSGRFRLTTNPATVNSTVRRPNQRRWQPRRSCLQSSPPPFGPTGRPDLQKLLAVHLGIPWHFAAGPVRAAWYEPRGTGDRATRRLSVRPTEGVAHRPRWSPAACSMAGPRGQDRDTPIAAASRSPAHRDGDGRTRPAISAAVRLGLTPGQLASIRGASSHVPPNHDGKWRSTRVFSGQRSPASVS
jgi:hypothetical protein